MAVLRVQVEKEARLLFILRREIGVTSLGWNDVPLHPVVNEIRFAEPRARAEDGDRSEVDAGAGVEDDEIGRRENRNAEGDSIEIVDEADASDRELLRQRQRVDLPRQVRDLGAIGEHRTGHRETRRIDRRGNVLA